MVRFKWKCKGLKIAETVWKRGSVEAYGKQNSKMAPRLHPLLMQTYLIPSRWLWEGTCECDGMSSTVGYIRWQRWRDFHLWFHPGLALCLCVESQTKCKTRPCLQKQIHLNHLPGQEVHPLVVCSTLQFRPMKEVHTGILVSFLEGNSRIMVSQLMV